MNQHIYHPVTGCRVDNVMGLWLIDPVLLQGYVDMVCSYTLKELHEHNKQLKQEREDAEKAERKEGEPVMPYQMLSQTALIRVSGPTTKHPTSFQELFGGTATTTVRQHLQHAIHNDKVRNILMLIDSPGGTVDGNSDMADAVRRANKVKPVYTHYDDNGTSAAQWYGSQASYVSASPAAMLGSIGTRGHLYDVSKKLEQSGIRVISLKTGKYKDVGLPGLKITEEQIAYLQGILDKSNEVFVNEVSAARNVAPKDILALEAAVLIGKQAQDAGLIDGIHSFEEILEMATHDRVQPSSRNGPANPELQRAAGTAIRGLVSGGKLLETAPKLGTDSPDRRRLMLSPEQLSDARRLPGAENITAENADTTLLNVAKTLHSQVAPMPKNQAERYIGFDQREIGFLEKAEKILPKQSQILKDAMKVENVSKDGVVMVPVAEVFKMLEANKPAGLLDNVTGDQVAGRTEPGSGDDKNTQMTPDQLKRLSETYNVNPAEVMGGNNGKR